MKRAILAFAVLLSLGLAACGGGSTTTSGISNRVFASDTFGGTVTIVNAANDTLASTGTSTTGLIVPFTITVGSNPTIMAVPPIAKPPLTLVFNSGSNTVSVINNKSESVSGSVTLPDEAFSLLAKDTGTAYAALRNAACGGTFGQVVVMDIATNFTVTDTICVPFVDRLVLSPDGSTLLAFSDPAATPLSPPSNSVYHISTASLPANGTNIAWPVTFDHAVSGVFSSDSSTVFILSCGPECGGSIAGVQAMNVAAGTPVGSPVLVPATMGFLNGNTLFVAGTTNGAAGAGLLNVLDVSTSQPALTAAKNLPISDGIHTLMALGSNNKLFIGSTGCTNNPNSATPTGCLSIYDISAGGNPVIDTACDPISSCTQGKGFVTGLTPIANRSVVYVVEGGVLRVFSTTTSTETGEIGISGAVADAKAVDQ